MTTPKAILKVRDTRPAKDSPPAVEFWLAMDYSGGVNVYCQREGHDAANLACFRVGEELSLLPGRDHSEYNLANIFPLDEDGAIKVQP